MSDYDLSPADCPRFRCDVNGWTEISEVSDTLADHARRKHDDVVPTQPVSYEAPTLPCPWCGLLVERIERGGYVREYCCKAHKTAYNNALSKLTILTAHLIRTPGALQAWSQHGVNPSLGVKSDGRVPGEG